MTALAALAGSSVRETKASDVVVPLLHTVESAAERLAVGRTKVFKLMEAGELESVKVGRLRRIPEVALVEYVERLRARAAA